MSARHSRKSGKISYGLSDIVRDIKALNSSILIISQKMKYLVRNEKILGRNLIVLNKKIKNLELKLSNAPVGEEGKALEKSSEEFDSLMEEIKKNSVALAELNEKLQKLKEGFAQDTELKELKHVIDAINPLEFVTLDQVNELIEQKLKKKKK